MDADGVVFRDYATAPAGLPRVQTGADTGSDALREAALVVAALPADLDAKVDHVEVQTVDEIYARAARRPHRRVGELGRSPTLKAEVLAELLAAAPRPRVYDVSVPAQPTTSASLTPGTTVAAATVRPRRVAAIRSARLPTVVTTARLT